MVDSSVTKARRQIQHEADVVVIGAGIMGCALAVALGNQGRSVLLLEKSLKEPDRIVGELLQPGGVSALEKLGLKGEHTHGSFISRLRLWKGLKTDGYE
jgi:squalene monooxygenase